jgi:hypothetical protein
MTKLKTLIKMVSSIHIALVPVIFLMIRVIKSKFKKYKWQRATASNALQPHHCQMAPLIFFFTFQLLKTGLPQFIWD